MLVLLFFFQCGQAANDVHGRYRTLVATIRSSSWSVQPDSVSSLKAVGEPGVQLYSRRATSDLHVFRFVFMTAERWVRIFWWRGSQNEIISCVP